METDQEYADSISKDVLRVLFARGFFTKLDDLLCPVGSETMPRTCDGTLDVSMELLSGMGFDATDLADIRLVLTANGGCCDCEVLYNVASESRLRSAYWKAEALRHESVRTID